MFESKCRLERGATSCNDGFVSVGINLREIQLTHAIMMKITCAFKRSEILLAHLDGADAARDDLSALTIMMSSRIWTAGEIAHNDIPTVSAEQLITNEAFHRSVLLHAETTLTWRPARLNDKIQVVSWGCHLERRVAPPPRNGPPRSLCRGQQDVEGTFLFSL